MHVQLCTAVRFEMQRYFTCLVSFCVIQLERVSGRFRVSARVRIRDRFKVSVRLSDVSIMCRDVATVVVIYTVAECLSMALH